VEDCQEGIELGGIAMYQIDLRRQAFKDLESIPTDYKHLISEHIDSLEQNPRPTDSKKLKGCNRISRLYGLAQMNRSPLRFQLTEELGLMML